MDVRQELTDEYNYPTLTSAVDAFDARGRRDTGDQVPLVALDGPVA
ncbi:MAG: hypothetical protein MZV65_12095 [Chromatiales bacterium]|nr:hypothetical protein [Chromatiales bacterium]